MKLYKRGLCFLMAVAIFLGVSPRIFADEGDSVCEHIFTEWYETKAPTLTENGEECRECKKCSHFERRDVELTVITSGNFGYGTEPTDSVIYTIYSNGTMVVEGEGKLMGCYWDGRNQPFIEYRDMIKEIILGEGITETSGGCFAKLTNLKSVTFPTTLKKLHNNAFMASFDTAVTSLTIPKNITHLSAYIFGYYSGKGTYFTDIVIENPEVQFTDSPAFNSGKKMEQLTLYSYGESNNVSAYAEKVGCHYIDLNRYAKGEFEGIQYVYYANVLTLKADGNNVNIPSENAPWHQRRTDVQKIVIGNGITGISGNAFADYTALKEIELCEGLKSIGDGAFSVNEVNDKMFSIKIPESVVTIGEGIFAGRTNVFVTAYYASVGSKLNESSVELKIKKQFKFLMIGNSYTEDASNRGQGMKTSQLFDILQAMLGEDTEVTLGTIINGGKGINWHATQAEQNTKKYSLSVATSENREWKSIGSVTSAEALAFTDWDAVSLQHYGLNTKTGQESISYPNETDEKFYPLETASEYMLDHIAKYAPHAEIYFYMHWAQTSTIAMNANLKRYNEMAAYIPVVLDYQGTESGCRFKNIVPVGLSVQNARTTYLSLLSYNTSAYADGNLNLYTDAQIGLQRDGGHLSFNIGRYIAALTFAEMVIPEEMRADGYVLPDIRITESVGKLPKEYTEIAQKAVHAAVDSWKNGSLAVTVIEGYEKDPITTVSAFLEDKQIEIPRAKNWEELQTEIGKAILALLPEDFAVDAVVLPEDITFKSEDQIAKPCN